MPCLHKTISLVEPAPIRLSFDERFISKDGRSILIEGRERPGLTFDYMAYDILGNYRINIRPIDHISFCDEGLVEVRFYELSSGRKKELGYFLAQVRREGGAFLATEMEIVVKPQYRNQGIVSQAATVAQKHIPAGSRFESYVSNLASIQYLARSIPALRRWPLLPLFWILSFVSAFYVSALGLCTLALFKTRLENTLIEKTVLGRIMKKAGMGDFRAEIVFKANQILPVKLPFLKLSGRKL
jgi:hypothetical protein